MTKSIIKYSWILSGVLLGLSYPGYDPIPTGILAWFAFVPFLLENQKSNAFKIYLLMASLLCIITMSCAVGELGAPAQCSRRMILQCCYCALKGSFHLVVFFAAKAEEQRTFH